MPLTSILGILFLDPLAIIIGIVAYPFIGHAARSTPEQMLKDLHPDTKIYHEGLGRRITAREALVALRASKD